MPRLLLRFPGGRYHATPWGHHVNEGLVEWPPSPWRILRALIACGYTTQHWDEVPAVAASLIGKLSGCLPCYQVPEATIAHSRHYMPLAILDKGREKTSLVFDTWLDVSNGCIEVFWDCDLTAAEMEQLRKLASCLGYLGRSESWVVAQAIEDRSAARADWNAVPHEAGMQRGPGWEQVPLMAAIPADQYDEWRTARVNELLAGLAPAEGKKLTQQIQKKRKQAVEPYPESLLDCLTKDTAWWKRHRWAQPPGSQRVLYWRPEGAIQVGAPARQRRVEPRRVQAMLVAMATRSGNRSALPAIERSLPQAELLHQALVSSLGGGQCVDCPELTGRDVQGNPLQESHKHAHIFPADLDGDCRLDHVLIFAPMGLGGEAQRAIQRLRRTWTKGGSGELQIAVAGSGNLDDLRRLPPPIRGGLARLLGPQDGARDWVSVTPFVPPRFLKQRGANTLAGQVQAELLARGLPAAVKVEDLRGTGALAMRHFVRRRQRGGVAPPADVGFAVRIRFAEPVRGPLALGYASHYGLGLFGAE